MRVRYSGPDAARDLLVPGGCIVCPTGEWVDVQGALTAGGIDPVHGLPAVLGLTGQPDWSVELDAPTAVKPVADAKPDVKADAPAADPATPDKE